MQGFLQHLDCGEHVLIRVGSEATAYRCAYERSCLGEIRGDTVRLMGFSRELEEGRMPPEMVTTALNCALDHFSYVGYERSIEGKLKPRWFQRSPTGEIIMKHAHPDTAKRPDGSYDLAKGLPVVQSLIGELQAGKASINPHGIQMAVAADGSFVISIAGKMPA